MFLTQALFLSVLVSFPQEITARKVVAFGEDGTPVYAESSVRLGHVSVEPQLLENAQRESSLKVILFLADQPGTQLARETKARYESEIREKSARLRELNKPYALDRFTASKDEEIQRLQERAIPDSTLSEMRAVQESLDGSLNRMKSELYSRMSAAVKPGQKNLEEKIQQLGGVVTQRIHVMNALAATIPSQSLSTLAELAEIAAIELDAQGGPELDISAQSIFAPAFWNDGIVGASFDAGIVDETVDIDQPYLNTHQIFRQFEGPLPPGINVFHGTYCAGIMASTHPTLIGIAYGCDKIISGYSSGIESVGMAGFDWVLSQEDGPEVINHSFGYGPAVLDDTLFCRFFDAVVSDFGVMVTKSAGNQNCASTPTITYPAPAWNILTVAATNDHNTIDRSDDNIASFSSSGPTQLGRKKPDLCAPGENITSLGLGNTTYTGSGTSAAAPHVGGAILLLAQMGNTNPLSAKAVLINTADGWENNDNCSTVGDQQVSGSEWNKSYGWGYINLAHAHVHATDYFLNSLKPKGQVGEFKLYKGPMSAGDKATLTWNRRAGYNGADYPNTWFALSDLNLALYERDSNSMIAQDVDPDDNVHQVASPGELNAVIRCYSWSTVFDGSDTEEFALATEEGFSEATGPVFSIALTFPGEVSLSQTFTLKASIQNNGDLKAFDDTATLTLPSGFQLVTGSLTQSLGNLAVGETKEVQWKVRAPSTIPTPTLTTRLVVKNHCNSYGADFLKTESAEIVVH